MWQTSHIIAKNKNNSSVDMWKNDDLVKHFFTLKIII